jgi:hypothetical protein
MGVETRVSVLKNSSAANVLKKLGYCACEGPIVLRFKVSKIIVSQRLISDHVESHLQCQMMETGCCGHFTRRTVA